MATYWHGQAWDTPPPRLTRREATNSCYWSMWQRRLAPYGALAPGDRVLVVDSFQHQRTVAWEYEVREVSHEPYRSLAEAARAISRGVGAASGLTRQAVRAHPYTRAAPSAGYLVAWRGRPLRAWYALLPADVHLARHGYTSVSAEELQRRGFGPRQPEGTGRPGRRVSVTQGQEADPKRRQEIEQYAINQATERFTNDGWTVRDRGNERLGYDLALTRPGRAARYVEVKGSTGGERAVRVTPGEVSFARDHQGAMILYVLHAIKAEQEPHGKLRCSGGTAHIEDPWEPDDQRLTVVTLRYGLRQAR